MFTLGFRPSRLVSPALLAIGWACHLSAAEVEGVTESAPVRTGLKGGERKAEPVVAPASDASEKARLKFRVPAGFVTDLWAAEPMLSNPVSFCFDGKGRLYTSETNRYRTSTLDIRHYMFMLEDDLANRTPEDWTASIKRNFPDEWQKLTIESEVIRVLEDSNGDGKADQSHVYADGFNSLLDGIASGILEHDGSVYFTNIPNLWKLDGMDANGRALKRESLHSGYGLRFSFTGHDFHGLLLAPDGRLYFSIGDRGAYVKTKEGTTVALQDMGGVFRCELDGSHLEVVMRGLRNPEELAVDDYGNIFTGDNDSDQGDRERWVMICEGADAGWRIGWQHNPLGKARNPWLVEKMWLPRAADTPLSILSPIANLPDGPSGLAHYPGTGMPEKYAGSFFLCSFKGSSAKSNIVTWKNKPSGAAYELIEQSTFVESVQATDVDFGPDSKMYFSEWGEGWERNNGGRIFRAYDPKALEAQAAQVEEVKRLLGEGFKQRDSKELSTLLGHKDQRVRLRAQWALVEKEDAAGRFAEVAAHGQGLARLHALWGLGHLARVRNLPAALQPAIALLADGDAEVRANAARVLGEGRVAASAESLLKSLQDESLRVRYFSAEGLGKLATASAVDPLFALLRENADRDQYVRHAAVVALAKIADRGSVLKAAGDPDKAIRTAALLVMHRLEMPEVARFLTDQEPLLVKEAARMINDTPIVAATPELAKLIDPGSPDEQLMVRVLNANFRAGQPGHAGALASYAAQEKASEGMRVEALTLLGQWAKPPARDRVVGVYRPLDARAAEPAAAALQKSFAALLDSPNVAVATAAVEAALALDLRSAAPAMLAVVQDANRAAKLRIAALKALAGFHDPGLRQALTVAVADKTPSLRIQAMGLLGNLDPAEAATQLSAAYAGSGVAEKKVILNSLGSLKNPLAAKRLTALMSEFQQQPAEAQLELLEAAQQRPEPEVKAAVQSYQASLKKGDPLAPFAVSLVGGNRAVGEKLFKEHAVAACLRCHKLGDQGGDAGPDLSAIGKRGRAYILESIITPSAQIAPGFGMVMVTKKDGSMVAGNLKKETPEALTLQLPGAAPFDVPVAEVKSRDNAPSGMLPNYADLLTKREIRDIVEYCAGLNTDAPAPGKTSQTPEEKGKKLKTAHVVGQP